jgi:tetratricopeptide (TPR) repeat protein
MRKALVGGVLLDTATRTRDLATFDEAIGTLREALAAMPRNADGRAGFVENLGRAHLNRWLVSRSPADHAEAVSVLLESVRITDADDPFRVRRMGFLANALMAEASSANKEKVLAVLREMREIGPGIRPSTLAMLANSWYLAWIRFKDPALLDTVIDLVKQVGESERGISAEERSRRLGDVLWARWARNRDVSDIDEIIGALGSQLSGMELGDPEALNLLARAMRARWESSGDSVAIEHAAALLSLAVERAPAGSAGKAMYLNNLASVLLRAGTLSRDREEVARAVELSRDAVAVAPEGDPGLPMYLHNHSSAHGLMWQVTRERAWLVDGLRLARRAVGVTPQDHPDRLGHISNLGGLLLLLGGQDGDPRLVEEAVSLLAPCADRANASDPAYGMVCIHLAQAFQRLRGTDAGDAGLDVRARALFRDASRSAPPRTADLVTFQQLWGNEAAGAGDWPEAARALTEAVGLLADHLGPRVSRVDQERSLADFSGLATDAAAACLAIDRAEDAVEVLEKGRGVLLAQSLRGDDEMRRLHEEHPELARRIEHLRTLLAESRDPAL